MIELTECIEMGCAKSVLKRHKDHCKEEKKKNNNHICTSICVAKEQSAHIAIHEFYRASRKQKV